MNILGFEIGRKKELSWQEKANSALIEKNISSGIPEKLNSHFIQWFPIHTKKFDGEKTPGELGEAAKYKPEYQRLALRSWEAYLKSDIAQIIVNGSVNWVIGPGLKLQAEPKDKVISREGYNFDKRTFSEGIEDRFSLYGKNRICDYSNQRTLGGLAKIAKKHAILGGDVLVVLRTNKKGPNIQLIDGIDVTTPWLGKWQQEAMERGNEIVHGVEVDNKGKHIAYYVINKDLRSWTRINAIGEKTKRLQAFLIYGNEYRVDDVRGLPLLSAVIEKIKKLDRYTEAVVGGAEERAKIAVFVKHGVNSTGQNPMTNAVKAASNAGEENKISDQYGTIEETSQKVAMTMNKQLINTPIDSSLETLNSTQEIHFGEFLDKNFVYIAASVNMPVEIALMLFQNNFSSSRMAAKMWEHILEIERSRFTESFYKPFYNLFLELEILKNKIQAEGYFNAIMDKDVILLEAFQNCRFVGAKVPHVDPLKEVTAEIKKIENQLTTRENATENLGGGDFTTNQEKLTEEEEIRFKPEPVNPPDPNQNE